MVLYIVRLYDVGDPNLIKIKGESAGTAEVIAYASDGTTIVCKVTVTPYQEPIYQVDPAPSYSVEEEPAYVPATEPESVPEPEREPASESYDNQVADEAAD